jgi:hypothetical protein
MHRRIADWPKRRAETSWWNDPHALDAQDSDDGGEEEGGEVPQRKGAKVG